MPAISIVIPAFNAERYIATALSSVVGQTWRDFEAIVVDDASADATADVVAQHAKRDPRIKLIRHEVNQGAAATRNTALAHATGEWVTMLDADDWYHPERLRTLVSYAQQSGARLLTDNQHFVQEGQTLPWRTLKRYRSDTLWMNAVEFLREDSKGIGQRYTIGFIKPFISRHFLLNEGIRYERELRLSQDFYFIMRCLATGERLLFVNRPLYYYRVRSASASRTNTRVRDAAVARVYQLVTDLFQATGQSDIVELIEHRTKSMERVERFRRMRQGLVRGQLGSFLLEIRQDPGVLADITRGLPRIAEDKLRRQLATARDRLATLRWPRSGRPPESVEQAVSTKR